MKTLGQLATVKEFSFNDATSHASMDSKFDFMEKIDTSVHVIITEEFVDYETGKRYIGIIQHKPENLKFNNDIVYFSEYSLVKLQEITPEESLHAFTLYSEYLLERISKVEEEYGFDVKHWKETFQRKHEECVSNCMEFILGNLK